VCAKDIREYDVYSRMMTMGPQRWVTVMNGVWTGYGCVCCNGMRIERNRNAPIV
jgi:acetyltransferase-like isoleucine patch superfamily enzyme